MAVDLRGASGDALTALSPRVRELRGEDAARVGEDLFAVADLLRAEPALRRVATDVSTDGGAKAELMRSVLGDKVAETSREVVADAAGRRWARSRDLADALEELGAVAVVRSAGDDADRLADELFAVRRLVEEQGELRSTLGDPARSTTDRAALLDGLLADRTLASTRRLAHQALGGSHRTVALALEAYEKVAAEVRGERVATVFVAQEPEERELSRLHAVLSRSYGRDVHLDVVIEPDLLGGMRVEIGDDVIDGTVSSRLAEAHRLLAG